MESGLMSLLLFLVGALTASCYPMSSWGSKRYGSGLLPLAPMIYYERDPPADFYYPAAAPADVSSYRLAPPPPPLYYDYLPYGYYEEGGDPMDEIHSGEESLDEREDDPYADTNKVFLRNLILAQMYQDAANRVFYGRPLTQDDYDDSGYVYGEQIDEPSQYTREDQEVRELKSLQGKKTRAGEVSPPSSLSSSGVATRRRTHFPENRWEKRGGEEQQQQGGAASTALPLPDKGQDEVVLHRPANPPRRPQRSYRPSPYDSLKRLLHLQDQLEHEAEGTKAKTQKRSFVPSEESLVEQLGSLKKSA